MTTLASTFLLFLYFIISAQSTNRPIIGVLVQEYPEDNLTYIPASYIKMVESTGARAAPIFVNKPQSYYTNLLNSINGVVFPGGDVDLTKNGPFVKTGNIIYNFAKQSNRKGKIFPILGVCQGMELLVYLSNNLTDPLSLCKGVENQPLPLEFVVDYTKTSLYSRASKADINVFQSKNVTANHHSLCLEPKEMKRTGLDQIWRVLTVNYDTDGMKFVSTMESPKYPIAAVQFHPEKTAYEWRPDQLNAHGPDAVRLNRIYYDWLTNLARMSDSNFTTLFDENNALIYNFNPVFTGKSGMLCLEPEKMKRTGLDKIWRALTVNYDANGMKFVSTMESPKYPIAGVQFHPEKTAYEWRPDQLNAHDPDAVRVNRLYYDWLTNLARMSDSNFTTLFDENNALIYNYNPVFTGKSGMYNDQIYFFNNK